MHKTEVLFLVAQGIMTEKAILINYFYKKA